MSPSRKAISLSEGDYDAVLDVIARLLSHRTTRSLTGLLRSHVLPLLDASTCFFGHTGSDRLRPRIIGAVGIPQSEFDTIQDFFQWSPLARHIVDRGIFVGAYDLDIPREKLRDSIEMFHKTHPGSNPSSGSYLDSIHTVLLTIECSAPAVVFGFHRLEPCPEPFSPREKRILDILRPHLGQAIRALVVPKKSLNSISIRTEEPIGAQNPRVEVTRASKIVDQNPEFAELFNSLPGDHLSSSLAQLLNRRIEDHDNSSDTRCSGTECTWYCLCPSIFRIDITNVDDDRWSLELHPSTDACSGFNPVLKQYGLTPKEKEICCRVRQGLDNQEVASQLFISFHTVKTHLRNVYRKLEIPSRPRLISFLNKDPSQVPPTTTLTKK